MINRLFLRLYFIIVFVGLIIILFWFIRITPSKEEAIKARINSYKTQEYEGVIINKFIDKKEHNYKKVVLKTKGQQKTILFNNEYSGIYDYLLIGDSISKQQGNLQIEVYRKGKDTIMSMRFYGMDLYTFE